MAAPPVWSGTFGMWQTAMSWEFLQCNTGGVLEHYFNVFPFQTFVSQLKFSPWNWFWLGSGWFDGRKCNQAFPKTPSPLPE